MSVEAARPALRVGGPVPPNAVYIERPSDAELAELLERGEYANVLCSRQMGKTSLLQRTERSLIAKGVKVALIDVAGYLGTPENADEWYRGLLGGIVEQLGMEVDVEEWWRLCPAATPNQRLIRFFRDEVAAKAGAIVVFLDEIDATLKLPYTDDFFVAIRAMYNDRPREPLFEKIAFCLVGVATPNELIKDRRTTPYNIGRTIELRDFDAGRDDLGPLFRALADDPQTGETLAREVLHWTGGHPYLTAKLCEVLVKQRATTSDDVEWLIEKIFPNLEGARSDVHFETVLRFFDERVDDRLTALTLYRRIHQGREEPDRTTPMHIGLKLAGIVKRDGAGLLVVRNPIYRRVFTAEWAKKAMPPASVIGMTLVLIPAGEFPMGSPNSDPDAYTNEKPQHVVRITRPFYLSASEVTQDQYRQVMGVNPSSFKGDGRLPVERVSWYDAIAFCNRLSEQEQLEPCYKVTGQEVKIVGLNGYRLPTEAEWEYACRAGSTTRYYFGDDAAKLGDYAWYFDNSEGRTHPVGQKKPNAWGLHDMHGNVWEWCWDGYDARYYGQSPAADPAGPPLATARVVRGGSWSDDSRSVRSASRFRFAPEFRNYYLGFRVARVPSGK